MRLLVLVLAIVSATAFAQRGPNDPLVHFLVQVSIFADRGPGIKRGVPPLCRDPSARSLLSGCQAPMRKTLLPHLGQVPFHAGLPFFMVTRCGFFISTFILSRTQ